MRRPRPRMADLIARRGLEIVPDHIEPDPFIPDPLSEPGQLSPSTAPQVAAGRAPRPATVRPCGHCMHGQDGHGSQYGALVGWHVWVPEQPSPHWVRTGGTP